jgi:hypothetical protein
MDLANRYVIARENNVVRVDFRREPDPPARRSPAREPCESKTKAKRLWMSSCS